MSRDDLIAVVWRDNPPPEIDTALNALLSKLRSVLRRAHLTTGASIDVRAGTVALRLPADVVIDIEEAANAVDAAEGGLRQQSLAAAWGYANVAVVVARRPFLVDEDDGWIEARRAKLRALLARGLQVLTTVSVANGESALALHYADEIVDLEPFRETGYQQLMRLHAQAGNRGEALRVFGRLRELLRDELGTSPSPQTEALFMEILTA